MSFAHAVSQGSFPQDIKNGLGNREFSLFSSSSFSEEELNRSFTIEPPSNKEQVLELLQWGYSLEDICELCGGRITLKELLTLLEEKFPQLGTEKTRPKTSLDFLGTVKKSVPQTHQDETLTIRVKAPSQRERKNLEKAKKASLSSS